MRLVFGLVLVLGIALAGGAMYMAKDRIGQYQAVLKNQHEYQSKYESHFIVLPQWQRGSAF